MDSQVTNLRVTNKMVLPRNTNLATINGQSLIEVGGSVDISIASFTSAIVNTGTTPLFQATVNVIDATSTTEKQVIVMQGQQATTLENSGEEPIVIFGRAKAGSIDFTISNSMPNQMIRGTFKILYSLL